MYKPKTIFIVTPDLCTGGAQRVACNLANEWSSLGHNVFLVSLTPLGHFGYPISSNVTLIKLPHKRARYSILSLRRILLRYSPDSILSVIRSSNIILWLSTLGLPRLSLVFREANTLDGLFQLSHVSRFLFSSLMRASYRAANFVICNSADTATDLKRLCIPTNHLRVIPNPVITHIPGSVPSQPPPHPWLSDSSLKVLLSVGRLHPQKGFSDLITSFSFCLTTNPNLRLIIAGTGQLYPALLAQVNALGLSRYVEFIGLHADLTPFYQYSSIYVCSSRWEGFGNVLVEALSCGTTIVSTDCSGGPRYILDHGKYGYLSSVANPIALANSIRLALSSPLDPALLCRRAEDFLSRNIAKEYLHTLLSSCT